MTEYNLIFGAVLLFNIAVTFRASTYWTKYFPVQEPEVIEEPQDDPTPLLKGDDDEGDNETEEKDGETDLEQGAKGKEPKSNAASDAAANIRHSQLLRKYLIVYLLAAFSDWLQGPYVYALYDAYGYSQHDIAVLFVAGFGSSMIFSFVGGIADQYGRRRFVILFAIIYSLSCMTKREYNRIRKSIWLILCCRLLLCCPAPH
mmetsp:Transcript_25972/g.51738  ORF Transcript_25972/g.51738 Transcript_25972/m.51738 type:complete len:202 (-) Transcript_25972:1207-1812(-)